MPLHRLTLMLMLLVALAACTARQPTAVTPSPVEPAPATPTLPAATALPASPPVALASPTAVPASPTTEPPPAPPTFTPPPDAPSPTPEPATEPLGDLPAEAILILEPGPGSVVTSPVRVAGVANPTFEQNLIVRLVTADGTELALQPTTIGADVGQRGPFSIELPFSTTEAQPGFIQVIAESPRDGGLTHVASVGVTLSPSGPADVRPAEEHPEDIAITAPQPGDTVSGGVVRVAGIGRAGFENTLVVDVLDADGNVAARQAITVNAPEQGQYGPFSVELPYTVSAAGPGRIVVRDTSPAFGGTAHLSSVEVRLEP